MATSQKRELNHALAAAVERHRDDESQPLDTQRRRVRGDGSSTGSPMVNVSTFARDIVGMRPGDDVDVAIYRDAVVIVPRHE